MAAAVMKKVKMSHHKHGHDLLRRPSEESNHEHVFEEETALVSAFDRSYPRIVLISGNQLLRSVCRSSVDPLHPCALDRIRQGTLEKKVLNTKGIFWQPRFAVCVHTLARCSCIFVESHIKADR